MMISSGVQLVLLILCCVSVAISDPIYSTYHGCSGWISSPNFPLPSKGDTHARYAIKVPQRHRIKLEVVRLQMKRSASCIKEQLTIHNGDNVRGSLIASLCEQDNKQVRNFKSWGRKAFIRFHANETNLGFGFLIRYMAVPKPNAPNPCPLTMPPSDGCDGGLKIFRGKSGTVTSPQHPLPYTDNRNCLYAIDVSESGSEMSISWINPEFSNDHECKSYWVKLYDPFYIRAMGPYCTFEYGLPFIYVMFKSHIGASGHKFGFEFIAHEKPLIVTTTRATSGTWTIPCGHPAIDHCLPAPIENSPCVEGRRYRYAPLNSHPWQVALTDSSGYMRCAGVVLHPQWVVVAARCVGFSLSGPTRVVVKTGARRGGGALRTSTISQAVVHPNFTHFSYDYNIALLRLEEPLEFDVKVRSLCLAGSVDFTGDNASLAKWGSGVDNYATYTVNRIKDSPLTILPHEECISKYGKNAVTDRMLCAASKAEEECLPDPGGPLVVRNHAGIYSLVGILSNGFKCDSSGTSGIFTNITAVNDWIVDNMVS